MTNRRFAAIVPVLLLCGAAAVFVQTVEADTLTFDPPITLSIGTGAALQPRLIVSGSNLYALWFQSPDVNVGQWDLMFRVSADGGAAWSPSLGSPARNLSNNPPNVPGGAEWPVAVATNGPSIYLAWVHTPDPFLGQVVFSRSDDGGQTFTPPVAVSQANVEGTNVKLTIANGGLVLVYAAFNPNLLRRDLYVRTSADGGTSWTPVQLLAEQGVCTSESFSPQLATDSSVITVLWNCGNTVFRRSEDGGLTFGTTQILASQNVITPRLATASGTTYAAWTQGGPFTEPTVRFRRSLDGGLTWDPSLDQPAAQVSDMPVIGADLGPRLVVDESGVYLGWESAFGGNLRVRRSTDGGVTWDPSVVAFPFGAIGQLFLQAGELFAISESLSGLLFTRSTDGGVTWDVAQTIGIESGNAPGSTMAVSGRDVYLAWQGEGFPVNSILLRHAKAAPQDVPTLFLTPSSLPFGSVAVGATKDLSFTVQNTGAGTLSGTVSAAAPFSIVGGSPFSLSASQSQAVTVRFSPISATTSVGNVTIVSNGGSASPGVQGQGVTLIADADGDRVPDYRDTCLNTPPGQTVDAFGCSAAQRDSDGDGVVDAVEIARGTDPNNPASCPAPTPPFSVQAHWGTVPAGWLNVVLSWQHGGSRPDGVNTEGVEKYRIYRRRLLPELRCTFRLSWDPVSCEIEPVDEFVNEVSADRLTAVLENLQDLVGLDGVQFGVSAVNRCPSEESARSGFVTVLPFVDSDRVYGVAPPSEPSLFVHGIWGDEATWKTATERLWAVFGWTEQVLKSDSTGISVPAAADMYRFALASRNGRIRAQAEELGRIIEAVGAVTGEVRVNLLGHSAGGLVSRAYLQGLIPQFASLAPLRVRRMATFGTPHQGSDFAAVLSAHRVALEVLNQKLDEVPDSVTIPYFGRLEKLSLVLRMLRDGLQDLLDKIEEATRLGGDLMCDLNPACSTILQDLQVAAFPLETDYVSLMGSISRLAKVTGLEPYLKDDDLVVAFDNQRIPLPSVLSAEKHRLFERNPVVHCCLGALRLSEGADYIGVLEGLGYPVLSIRVHSPVSIGVVDPLGNYLFPWVNRLPGATYTASGDIEIPVPLRGTYQVHVLPDPSAPPTATYTIEAEVNGTVVILAQDQEIQSIPSHGYTLPVAGVNRVPIGLPGSNRSVRLNSLVTLDGSGSRDPDSGPAPLAFAWTQTAGPAVILGGGSLSVSPTFIPTVPATYTFQLVVNDGQDHSAPASVTITVPKLGDVDGDGDVDNNDLNLILAARNTSAIGPNDLRDLNGDGKIDALDSRILVTKCTRPRCATQ